MARIKLVIQRPWIPYVIFALTLTLTILSTFYVTRATQIEDELRFLNAVQDTNNTISERLNIYITLLRAVQGLYATNSQVTKDQFNIYVKNLNLQNNYQAVQGLGFVQIVNDSDKDSFNQTLQNENNPKITIFPKGTRQKYYVVRYLNLRDNGLSSSIGYDMATNPIRFKAMQTARDTGLPTMSGKINLLSKTNSKPQVGFLIVTPVYMGGRIPKNLEEKRNDIEGFIYSPFESSIFFQGILGDKTLPQLLNFQIYDGLKSNQKNLLYDSELSKSKNNSTYLPKFNITRKIAIAGETWIINYSNHPQFEAESQENLSVFIFIGGLFVSIMLFILSRSQYMARTNAEIVANKLQYSQKELQKAVGLRDNFISIASHELKTPVTSLKVYAEMLLRQFSKKGDVQTTDYLSKIIKQIDKLTMLIQDLLNVARIQSNQLTFRIEKFDLNIMVKEIIDNTQQIAVKHKIILKGNIDKKVWGDRDRISQVLINLLTNAMKYSPKANTIIVTLMDNKSGATVSVKDFGIGISRTHQRKIFGRFYRINDTNEQTFPGLGIGLYISQTIVKRHGGEIVIKSTKGKGSVFQFSLPYSKNKLIIDDVNGS
jgi:signal transduction histidine kinase